MGGKGAHRTKATWKGAERQATVPKSFFNTAERIKLYWRELRRRGQGVQCTQKWVGRMLDRKDGVMVQFEH